MSVAALQENILVAEPQDESSRLPSRPLGRFNCDCCVSLHPTGHIHRPDHAEPPATAVTPSWLALTPLCCPGGEVAEHGLIDLGHLREGHAHLVGEIHDERRRHRAPLQAISNTFAAVPLLEAPALVVEEALGDDGEGGGDVLVGEIIIQTSSGVSAGGKTESARQVPIIEFLTLSNMTKRYALSSSSSRACSPPLSLALNSRTAGAARTLAAGRGGRGRGGAAAVVEAISHVLVLLLLDAVEGAAAEAAAAAACVVLARFQQRGEVLEGFGVES
eukprot:CAMPEP_0115388212 /NCGR_PEP_ID=MMETSP0271-20121206/9058_1 /TAXON_ID=71861 /ORGANISM="Scrippsiella trochoidea, Strain CCMP3099" /LENGTH=274 /DNA_ID=CAMNT_0002811693 /DNA_START=171 /DNA_END=992 /DNA_ORIENTATION=-